MLAPSGLSSDNTLVARLEWLWLDEMVLAGADELSRVVRGSVTNNDSG